MGRPFIEFIQAQVLAWKPCPVPGRVGVAMRELSADPETGARSLLLRYPPGWRADDSAALSADEELLLLAGELSIGGSTYPRYGYAHLPAGYPRGPMSSRAGAVALTFFSASPEVASAGGWDPARVASTSCFDGPWTGNFHPRFPAGAGRKFLRQDPYTGEQTWVLGTMPLRWGRRPEKHPVVEEMYLLAGELVGQVGVMHAGAYFWRPPEEWHGPFGSPTGNLMLFRTIGGPLSTVYTEDEVDFSWQPAHRPILPAHLAPAGGRPWPGATCF